MKNILQYTTRYTERKVYNVNSFLFTYCVIFLLHQNNFSCFKPTFAAFISATKNLKLS